MSKNLDVKYVELPRGRIPEPKAYFKDAIIIMKRYAQVARIKRKSYSLVTLAKEIDVKYGTLKAWMSKNEPPTIKAWKKFQSLDGAGELIKEYDNIIEEPLLVPACSVHGINCPHKCKPDKPKKPKKATWKLTKPRCPLCNKEMDDLADMTVMGVSTMKFGCIKCNTRQDVIFEIRERYKY